MIVLKTSFAPEAMLVSALRSPPERSIRMLPILITHEPGRGSFEPSAFQTTSSDNARIESTAAVKIARRHLRHRDRRRRVGRFASRRD